MKKLFGETFSILTRSIQLREKRHAVISSNIANVDTPGYRAKELPFAQVMAREFARTGQGREITLRRTHPRHLADPRERVGDAVKVIRERGTPNDVDIDQEMAKLMENNLQYQATVQALIKQFDLLRAAVTEGGRT